MTESIIQCSKCGEPFVAGRRYGKRNVCRPCYNEYAKEYYYKNREAILASRRTKRRTDPGWLERERSVARDYRVKYPERKKSSDLKSCYGINLDDYETIVTLQGGGCKICGARPQNPQRNPRKYLDVDHEGPKGAQAFVRGILCNACNLALGKLNHNIDLLEKAIQYLVLANQRNGRWWETAA